MGIPDATTAKGEVMRFTIALCAPVDRSSDFIFMFLACCSSFPAVSEVIVISLYVVFMLVLFDFFPVLQMMLATAEDYFGYKSRGLGHNDLEVLPITALVHFTPSADGSNGTKATLVFENVPLLSKLNGWIVEPVSMSTEVCLSCNLYCFKARNYNSSIVTVVLDLLAVNIDRATYYLLGIKLFSKNQ